MLYGWLEAQRELIGSVQAWTDYAGQLCGLPKQRRDRAVALSGCDRLCRLLQAAPAPPPFAIGSVLIGARRVAIDESVAEQTPFCALRRFTRRGEAASPAVLLCAPLAGHHAVMLRETVETLLKDADVYVTDWANARDVPAAEGPFALDDYVLTLMRFLRFLADMPLHVLAVCQAAVPTIAAAALTAARGEPPPLSLTLMGGPIDTRLAPTAVDRLAATHSINWFRETVIDTVPRSYRGAGRRIYPGYLQHAAIVAAYPHRQLALESNYWTSRLSGDAARIVASLRALNEYEAVLDMAEDYFLDTLRVIFQEQRLAHGTWDVAGRRVDCAALAMTALCTVEGDRDDITGAGQTHAAHAACSALPESARTRLTIDDCDHYDLFTGPRWRETIHPALAAFWRTHAADRHPS